MALDDGCDGFGGGGFGGGGFGRGGLGGGGLGGGGFGVAALHITPAEDQQHASLFKSWDVHPKRFISHGSAP